MVSQLRSNQIGRQQKVEYFLQGKKTERKIMDND